MCLGFWNSPTVCVTLRGTSLSLQASGVKTLFWWEPTGKGEQKENRERGREVRRQCCNRADLHLSPFLFCSVCLSERWKSSNFRQKSKPVNIHPHHCMSNRDIITCESKTCAWVTSVQLTYADTQMGRGSREGVRSSITSTWINLTWMEIS